MFMVTSPRFMDHRQTFGHPERPERLSAVLDSLAPLQVPTVPIESCEDGLLEKVHVPSYLDLLRMEKEFPIDADTYHREDTWAIAREAVDATVTAARMTLERKEESLALVRPPGHHADSSRAMGFCYLNNAAIAARALLDEMESVAVVDLDVHHGNGTADIFEAEERVLYVSAHEWGNFPGTGHYTDSGPARTNYNIPLYPGTGDATYAHMMKEAVVPALKEFGADTVVLSMGVDSHERDPLGGFTLSTTAILDAVADLREVVGHRIIHVMEGGYDLESLADVWSNIYRDASGMEREVVYSDVEDREGMGIEHVDRMIEELKGQVKLS